jgi:hypothetical protein
MSRQRDRSNFGQAIQQLDEHASEYPLTSSKGSPLSPTTTLLALAASPLSEQRAIQGLE